MPPERLCHDAPMTALVVVGAVAIGLLAVLVAGLLRSHAEILRALHSMGVSLEPGQDPPPVSQVSFTAEPPGEGPALDLVGVTPADETVHISVAGAGQPTLVAFLSSGCTTCSEFWKTFGEGSPSGLQHNVRVVIVTKGPEDESPSKVRELAPRGLPTVMSTAAWEAYEVPVVPYFAYVDGPSGRIVSQGAANTWDHVRSLIEESHARGVLS